MRWCLGSGGASHRPLYPKAQSILIRGKVGLGGFIGLLLKTEPKPETKLCREQDHDQRCKAKQQFIGSITHSGSLSKNTARLRRLAHPGRKRLLALICGHRTKLSLLLSLQCSQ
jgi:hypothetical protein